LHETKSAGHCCGETLFIDGTKLEACANKYTIVWKKSVGRWENRMSEKIEAVNPMDSVSQMQMELLLSANADIAY